MWHEKCYELEWVNKKSKRTKGTPEDNEIVRSDKPNPPTENLSRENYVHGKLWESIKISFRENYPASTL